MMSVNAASPAEGGYRAMMGGEAASAGQGGAGAFAELLLTLFGGGEESGLMAGLLGKRKENFSPDAMAMMAELLAGNTGLLPTDMMALLTGEGMAETAGAGGALTALAGQEPAVLQQLLSGLETVSKSSQTGQELTGQPAAEGGFLEELNALAVEQAGGSGGQESLSNQEGNLFDGQLEFRRSVAEARQALEEEPKPKAEALDIDALQQRVNAERPNMTAALREKTQTFQLRDSVVNQVKENILKNLGDGDSEFTIRLKPESLGEITIKMVQSEGKISMSILTASTETAKLLNQSVEALKNALRPLQAEVREIIPRPEQADSSQQSGFFGSGFESFQHQQHYTSQQPAYYPEHLMTEEPEIQEAPAEVPAGLNAYV